MNLKAGRIIIKLILMEAATPKLCYYQGWQGDVADILTKMRVAFSELEIDVETTQTEKNPKVFRDIHITYKIKTAKDNEDKVKKAIELSLNKYCGVSAMLRKNSPINYSLEIKK